MPYKTIAAAKAADFPIEKEDIALTLPQINKLAEIYDAIKAGGNADNAFPVAWVAWKNVYKKVGDKWVLAKGAGEGESFETWIPVAKAEQTKKSLDGTIITLTGKALEKDGSSLSNGRIKINHKALLPGFKMPQTKYEYPFLLMNADDKNIYELFRKSDVSGWSVELDNLVMENNKVIGFNGGGISLLYSPHMPACTPKMGCHETFETYISDIHFEEQNTNPESLISRWWAATKAATTTIERIKPKKEDEENRYKTPVNIKMEKVEELAAELATAKIGLVTQKTEFEQLRTANVDTATKLKAKTAEFEALQTKHKVELDKANAQIAKFEQEKADKRKALLDAQWETLKKESIPPGLVHKKEDEEKLHEKFEKDPHSFMIDLTAYEKVGGTGKEGEEHNPEGADNYAQTNAEFEGQLGGKV